MDLIIGSVSVLIGIGCLWKAITGREFYAATIIRTEHSWRYPTWLGRIVAASIGIMAIWLGLMAFRQSFK